MQYFKSILLVLTFSPSLSQEIPHEFFLYQLNNLLIDSGENWENNTTLGNIRYQDLELTKTNNLHSDSLYIESRFGIYALNNSVALYGFGHFIYQKYLYGYLYPRITNNSDYLFRYTGIPRTISRKGFNSGETDLSGIGFQNKWLYFQLGRGREVWGAGNQIQLALSQDSPAYDYFMLGSDYGRLRVKYIHGFLENVQDYNRYITGKGLEFTNRKNLIIGLSEIIIYSGKNRPMDFGYMNPISTHLEVELNERLNISGGENANAIWQLSFDYLFKKKLRISINYLFDEFVIDEEEKRRGKEHGKAHSVKFVYIPTISNQYIFNIYISHILVGTPTFRHGNGMNNFIVRNKPIGWKYGSDSEEFKLGLKVYNKMNFNSFIELGIKSYGEETLRFRPYDKYKDYIKSSFPSGDIGREVFVKSDFNFWVRKNLSLNLGFEMTRSNKDKIFNKSLLFGVNIHLPINFAL